MAGIYIHIPFCSQACYYCDFYFRTSRELIKPVIDSICKELTIRKEYVNEETIETIYFGGGTPSILENNQIEQILNVIYQNYSITDENIEITLEANPNDINKEKLTFFHSIGINRLSIGIQTFNDNLLKFLHRSHDVKQAHKCLKNINNGQIDNFNIDIIYGIPNQTQDDLLNDIKTTLNYNPKHISAYILTIEDDTVFGKWRKDNRFKSINDDIIAKYFLLIDKILTDNHFIHYEVSNYCLNNYISKHNSSYWESKVYLGVGPSAHSYNLISRQWNIANNIHYIESLSNNKIPTTIEYLSDKEKLEEYLLTHLRTNKGIEIYNEYQNLNNDKINEYIKFLLNNNLCTLVDDTLKVTSKGYLFVDEIVYQIFKRLE